MEDYFFSFFIKGSFDFNFLIKATFAFKKDMLKRTYLYVRNSSVTLINT